MRRTRGEVDRSCRSAAVVSSGSERIWLSWLWDLLWESKMATERQDLPGQAGQKIGTGIIGEGSEDPQQVLHFTWECRIDGALPWDGWWISWELLGHSQRAEQCSWCSGEYLPQTDSEGRRRWGLLWTVGRRHPREGDFIHVYKYLMGGCRDSQILSGIQWKDKRWRSRVEIQEMPFKHQKTSLKWGCLKADNSCPERL